MARNYIFAPGEYYHIYARGIEKLPIYRDTYDFDRFIESLYVLNTRKKIDFREIKKEISEGLTFGSIYEFDRDETITDIGAYCLMTNHFHLLVREKDSNGKGVSKFMQKLMTSYTMYFNKKYDRTGAIFGSSFKARHVEDDNHLKYLFAYIHLNPRELTTDSKEYTYSSILDYRDSKREEEKILNRTVFPDYFEEGIDAELNEWLNYKPPKV